MAMVTDDRRVVLVTGMSGSGKSSVARCFEDLGFYCVDNLPVGLLRAFLSDPFAQIEGGKRIAAVTDVRAAGFVGQLPQVLSDLGRAAFPITVLYLEASEEALLRRFSETRRPHPLADGGSAIDGIRRERQLLEDLRGRADLVFDTSAWSIHEIRAQVHREFGGAEAAGGMSIRIESFGFKFGTPHGVDLMFDVRFLPNPYFVPELRERTGLEEPVVQFLVAQPDFEELVSRLSDLLLYLVPRYMAERRAYLSVAIGCTGGKHRSVAIAERIGGALDAAGFRARVVHRDVTR
jgi:UPF0042 nucleotide-binding protein